jgi:hypothetical protein
MTHAIIRLQVHAIDAERLAAMRSAGSDEQGNAFVSILAEGWEPLRCCLQIAGLGEDIALISYAPLLQASPWREVGPVFVHGTQCDGYQNSAELPEQLRTGPRVLRSYRANGSLDYDHITVVPDGEDIEPSLDALLAAPEVAEVHVRAYGAQCFTYAVTR